MLGQTQFYLGSNFLCFSKSNLKEQDKINLTNFSDFDILMSIMNTNAKEIKHTVSSAKIVLTLLFPQYEFVVMPNLLILNKETDQGKEQAIINNDNYEQFRSILKEMFCLDVTSSDQYNPANKKAAQIAKKLQERKVQVLKIFLIRCMRR